MDDDDDAGVGGKNDGDLSLPKTTVMKLIKEMLPTGVKCANETRDVLVECCVEFVHLISSESNELCGKESKKTITPEHVIAALEELGFKDYVPAIVEVHDQHKQVAQKAPTRGARKLKSLGIPEEELLRQQQELFAHARSNLSANTAAASPAPFTSDTPPISTPESSHPPRSPPPPPTLEAPPS